MEVWECDLIDVQNLSKFKDNYKYLLSVLDLFSKFLHLVPLNTAGAFTVDLAQTIVSGSQDKWKVVLCEFTYPPLNTGTTKPVIVVGTTNCLIYCNLTTPRLWVANLC